ncbi:MAG: hypothetical protein ACNA7J_13900, partial [Wenzhouxiangella sp.]
GPYMPVATRDDDGNWIPQTPSFGEWEIRWYAGDPDNGGVLVSVETLEVVVTDASVQIQAMPAERIAAGSTKITDVGFAAIDGEARLTLNFLLDADGYITGQALADLNAQNPGVGGDVNSGFFQVWGDRPDDSVTHVRWPWFEGELSAFREDGIGPYMPVATRDDDGNWIPREPSFGEWLVEWYVGHPDEGGLRVGAETLEVVVTNESKFQDLLSVDLAGLEAVYQQGDMETGSEQVVFDYTANAGDIEQVFNVFRLFEDGVEIDAATYQAIFESVEFVPAHIRGLSGTDASVVTAPGDLGDAGNGIVSIEFLLADDAPLGDYDIVITSYDVTGIDPNDVALGETGTYRVLDTASQAISLIQGPDLHLTIDGPAMLPLVEVGHYDVRLQNLGDAAVDENVEVQFAIARAGIEPGDVVIDYCIDPAATSGEACGDWAELTLAADNGSLSSRFGPAEGFEVDADYDRTTFIRAEFTEPGNYEASAYAVGVDSSETFASGMADVAVTALSFDIDTGVDPAIPSPDEGEGWAYYTATLVNLGDELPENVLLWVDVDGIGQVELDDGNALQWFNPETESWTDFGWGMRPEIDIDNQREAFFLGRDGMGGVIGFPVGDNEDFPTPIRVNFDNATYDLTVSVETADQTAESFTYGLFDESVVVESIAVELSLVIEEGLSD